MSLVVDSRADDLDKHEWDVNCLLFHKENLYSGGDDGKIMAWTADLKKIAEVQAHPCSVYSLTANNDSLYSCSNEGTIKSWDLKTLEERSTIVNDSTTEFWKICYSDDCLFSGDDKGNIKVYKNNVFYGEVNIAEPIKDMAVCGTLVFTVKDLDLVITEIKLEGKKIQFGTKKSYMGRAPVSLIGEKFVAFSSREGRDIIIHENNMENNFKEVTKITNASDMLINALYGIVWDKEQLFCGGWDKILKRWDVSEGAAVPAGSCNVDIVINAITSGEKGFIYCGGSDGHILRIVNK